MKNRTGTLSCFWLLSFILLIVGCNSKIVNYNEIEKPIAVKKGNLIELKIESVVCSECWVRPKVQIEQAVIYLSGELILMSVSSQEQPTILSIEVPDSAKNYQIFWVNEDGKRTEIAVHSLE